MKKVEYKLTDAFKLRKEHSNEYEWRTLTYPKRHHRTKQLTSATANGAATSNGDSHVFNNFDLMANDCHRKLKAAATVAVAADAEESSAMPRSDDESDDDVKENGGTDATVVKKVKEKKIKKPKITVAEAAAKIDVSDLAVHLLHVIGNRYTINEISRLFWEGVCCGQYFTVSLAEAV